MQWIILKKKIFGIVTWYNKTARHTRKVVAMFVSVSRYSKQTQQWTLPQNQTTPLSSTSIPLSKPHHLSKTTPTKKNTNSMFPSSSNHLMRHTNCETFAGASNGVLSTTLPSLENLFPTLSSYSSPLLSLSSLLSSFMSLPLLLNSTLSTSRSSFNYRNQPSLLSPSSLSTVSSQGTKQKSHHVKTNA